MNVGDWLLWGFGATVVLTTIMAASHALGLTRMSIPYMLGTMLTPDRDRAQPLGIAFHMANGWLFSLVYVAAFHSFTGPSWWPQWGTGAAVGLAHAAFVLLVAMPMLPGMHPRMASTTAGPRGGRRLEPPGFLALNYGMRTPVAIVLAHLAFGVILGACYRV